MDWTDCLFIQKPAYQALLCLLFTPVLLFIIKPKSTDKAWAMAACIFILFLAVNTALLWFDPNPWCYFFYSIGVSLGYLLCISVIMPFILRALKLKSPEESAMAFLIIIYHPFALLLIMLMKWIVRVI